MAFTIRANTLVDKHSMTVDDGGVEYIATSLGDGKRQFDFSEIACALLSSGFRLSVQVGREVFSIPTQPDNPEHQDAIAMLVRGAQESEG
jgi:hypothetical protein